MTTCVTGELYVQPWLHLSAAQRRRRRHKLRTNRSSTQRTSPG